MKPVNVAREPIVLTVARVEPVKGIHDLIKAFAMVADRYSPVEVKNRRTDNK